MIKRFILFIIISSLYCFANSQATKTDSLLKVLAKTGDDTSRVNTLNDLFKENQSVDPSNAFKFAKQALVLAEKINFSRGIASSLNNVGLCYFNEGKSSEALVYYLDAYDIFTLLDNKRGEAITTANIGYLYFSQDNYKKAIEYYYKSLLSAEEITDSSRVAALLGNLGIIYYNQGYYSKSLDLYLKSLKIRENMGDMQGVAYVYGNLGLIYDAQGDLDKSLVYYNKSLAIREEINDSMGIASALCNIGEVHNTRKEYTKALENFQKAFYIASAIDYQEVVATALINIGDVYNAQGDFTKATEYYNKTLALNKNNENKRGVAYSYKKLGDVYYSQMNFENALKNYQNSIAIADSVGLKDLLKDDYKAVSTLYVKMGNFEKAYLFHALYSDIRDSIYNEESINQIADMQAKYETEKQEEEINLLKKESEVQTLKYSKGKLFVFFISGTLILFIIFAILTFRAYRLNKKAKVALEIQNKEISEQKELITKSRADLAVEKQKSDNLLLNILPFETAEELKTNGYASVRHYNHVSVMFTDFVDFTRITENLTPVELIGELNKFFIRFDDIIGKYNLEKIKTIGDAYMCAGGLPHRDSENPKKVVLAALEIQKFVNECNKEKLESNEPIWEIRIGIHTGDIIAGVVGKKKFAYDIWGDTVNTASRMESSGESGKINISGYTYKYVRDYFDCTYRGKVKAKNKEDIDMYFVDGIKKDKILFQEGGQPFQKM